MAHSNTDNRDLITASFEDRDSADRAYDKVVSRQGYSEDDVTVLMSDNTRKRHYDSEEVEIEKGNKAAEGAGVGAATGGTVGGVAGALLAAGGAVLLPGLGLAIAGPLAATLAGAGAGGTAGTLVGALIGAGISEERAKNYQSDIESGHIVLGVHPHNAEDARHFMREWRDVGGQRIDGGSYRMDEADEHDAHPATATSGAATEHTPTSDDFTAHREAFTTHHADTFGSDTDYTAYEPAYRFGHKSAQEDYFEGRSYEDAKDDLRRRFNERHSNRNWEQVKRAVRHAYRRARKSGTRNTATRSH